MSSVQKIDLENTIVRVLVTNVSHLYETEIEGNLTIEKDIVAQYPM